MKLWFSSRRPSALAALCAPAARGNAVGQLAVQRPGLLATTMGAFAASGNLSKINYIGVIAKGDKAALVHCDQPVRVQGTYQVQAEMVGGIPPRGRPV